MSFWGSLGNLVGATSSYDGTTAQNALDSTSQQNRDTLAGYNNQNAQASALNTSLGNTNYYGNAQQVYAQQQTAANMLQAQANGTAPSAAAIQQGVGLQAANANAQSAALSQQGAMNPALAARNLLASQAQTAQGVIATGTAQRATEQAQAQQTYASTLANMQSQQQAQGQLQYQQGQNMLGNQVSLANQSYSTNMNNAQNIYNNTTGHLAAQAAANSAQATALGGTLSSVAGGVSGLNIGTTAKNVLSGAS